MDVNTALQAPRRNCASKRARATYELPTNYHDLKRKPMVADGDYSLEIVESTYLANDGGTGMVLRFLLQVIDGPRPSTLLTIDVTLEHEDDLVAADGQREFAALRRALDVLAPEDTEELHFKSFRATVGRRQASASQEDAENYFSAFHGHAEPRAKGVCAVNSEPQRDERGRYLKQAA